MVDGDMALGSLGGVHGDLTGGSGVRGIGPRHSWKLTGLQTVRRQVRDPGKSCCLFESVYWFAKWKPLTYGIDKE